MVAQVFLILGIFGALAMAQSMQSKDLSAADQKFVKSAAQGGMAEVQLGQLATEKASSDAVKQFGQRMVNDHSEANNKLKDLAANKGVTLPQELSAKDRATKERLSKLSGKQFDHAYMADMLKDHKADIAEFQRESNSGHDQQVKEFASGTLPTLQDHLKAAEKISATSGMEQSSLQ
jgi:putative membrane protein